MKVTTQLKTVDKGGKRNKYLRYDHILIEWDSDDPDVIEIDGKLLLVSDIRAALSAAP